MDAAPQFAGRCRVERLGAVCGYSRRAIRQFFVWGSVDAGPVFKLQHESRRFGLRANTRGARGCRGCVTGKQVIRMPYFPQLSSGGTAQYPIKKRYKERTIVNTCEDGHTIKLFDPGAASQEWQLVLQDLTDSEIDALQQFFASSEGRLNSFTFLDPLNNLLMWSDAPDQTVWQRSSLLQVQLNIDDPIGGINAARLLNSTATDLTLQQTVNTPGWYSYCFSLYVRSTLDTNISLQLQAG